MQGFGALRSVVEFVALSGLWAVGAFVDSDFWVVLQVAQETWRMQLSCLFGRRAFDHAI